MGDIHPKRQLTRNGLHGVTSQNTTVCNPTSYGVTFISDYEVPYERPCSRVTQLLELSSAVSALGDDIRGMTPVCTLVGVCERFGESVASVFRVEVS
jgi:hypothetical protein